jgi:Multicopper oxidase
VSLKAFIQTFLGVTRYYEWTVARSTLAPDGVPVDVMLVNGEFPGPLIEANWGDWQAQHCTKGHLILTDDAGSKLTYTTRSKDPRKVPQYTGTVRQSLLATYVLQAYYPPVERWLIPEQAYISSVPLGQMVYQLLASVRSYRGAISHIGGKLANMARHGGIATIPLSIVVEPRVLL